jgi:hypothetical protein
MRKYDVQATMVCTAVVEATSEEEARGIMLTMLLNLNEANTAQSGESYGVASVTEFSIGYNREDEIDVDEATDISRPCECFNCGWKGSEDDLNEIKDFHQRVEPGDTAVPAGECPECGCLAYLKEGDE